MGKITGSQTGFLWGYEKAPGNLTRGPWLPKQVAGATLTPPYLNGGHEPSDPQAPPLSKYLTPADLLLGSGEYVVVTELRRVREEPDYGTCSQERVGQCGHLHTRRRFYTTPGFGRLRVK